MSEVTTTTPATQLPFVQPPRQEVTKATEKIEMQRATAEVFASHQRAVQYPRDAQACLQEIERLCDNIYFAADAIYAVPNRGQGLKVQTMKTLALIWGNIDSGTMEHGTYGEETQCEAWAIDLEKNFKSTVKYTVSHRTKVKDEIVLKTDPADILLLVKSRSSKEVRNAIKGVIPDWIQDRVILLCKEKLNSEVRNVMDSWNGWKNLYEKLGVTPASLLRRADVNSPDKLTAAHIVDMRILYQDAKEDLSVLDYFFPERDKSKTAQVEKAQSEKKAAATEPPKQKEKEKEKEKEKPEPSPAAASSAPPAANLESPKTEQPAQTAEPQSSDTEPEPPTKEPEQAEEPKARKRVSLY